MTLMADSRGVIVACQACGRRNRIAFGRPARCGHCRTGMPPVGAPVEIPDSATFTALIRDSPLPIVVDFWAPWCGPCRMVAPEIQRVAERQAGRWLVVKVNTEDLSDLAATFGIQSIPTMAVFSGGREVARTSGARPAPQIESFVEHALAG
jgi:thioredoxin 2